MKKQPAPIVQRAPALQGAALGLGVLGLLVVKHWPMAAVLIFAAGGLCLVLARQGVQDVLEDSIPALAPRAAWEAPFLAALLALGLLTFSWRLGSVPEGANYSEGYLVVRAMAVAGSGQYLANDDAETPWPTLFHYEGATAVKWFGFSAGNLRLPSVAWAMLILVAVYFCVRVLFSAPTAAITSLLWLAFHFNMHFARRFCPIIILYLPPFLGLAAIVLALRTGRWWWWAAAGFAIGLSLHGYLPGRVVPGVFAIFSVWLWFHRSKWALQAHQMVLMWTVFVITAFPVLHFAVTRPGDYNNYFRLWGAVNKESFKDTKSIQPYVTVFRNQVTPYLQMFHIRGNSEYEEDDSYGRPVLDPVMGLLFPLGFFFCLWRLWRGVPFYLMVLFWAGLMPGIYSKLGVPPFPRREVIAFPAVFLMAALVLEELRLGLFKAVPTKRWISAGLLIGSVLLVRQWRHYWEYTHSPGFRRFSNAMGYYTGRELDEHRAARAIVSQSILQSSPSRMMLMPANVGMQEVGRAEDFVFLDPGPDALLLLAPYLEPLIPTLKELYPHADVKLYREPAYDDKAFLKQQMRDTIFNAFCADLTNPSLILGRVLVPAADIDARNGWLDLGGGKGTLKDSDPNTAQGLSGLSRLGATVAVDTRGTTLTISLPWPGWRAKMDGKALPLNKPFFAPGNFRYLELEGVAPKGVSGAFPAAVLAGPSKTRLHTLAWHFDQGLKIEWLRGMKPDWERKADYYSTLLVPVLRYDEDYRLVDYPAQTRITGTFTPPSDGEWHVRLRWPGAGEGTVHLKGGSSAPAPEGGPDTEAVAVLKAGQPVPLRINYDMQLSLAPATAFLLEAKGPGDADWHWIDAHTLRPQ